MDCGDILLRSQESHGRDHQGTKTGIHDPGSRVEGGQLQHDEGKYYRLRELCNNVGEFNILIS